MLQLSELEIFCSFLFGCSVHVVSFDGTVKKRQTAIFEGPFWVMSLANSILYSSAISTMNYENSIDARTLVSRLGGIKIQIASNQNIQCVSSVFHKQIFTLFLVPFQYKLINYSSNSESPKIRKKSSSATFSSKMAKNRIL